MLNVLILSMIFMIPGEKRSSVDPVCQLEATLESFVMCIKGFMPLKDSEGFVVPNGFEQSDWKTTVTQMLEGECEQIVLPASLVSSYTILDFFDTSNENGYCILFESLDENNDGVVDKGWGTFIVNKAPLRNLDIAIPHPLNDSNTGELGIAIFKRSDARSFTMAGAHRASNIAPSPCQSDFGEADAAHNEDMLFHQTVLAVSAYYSQSMQSFSSVQFHGMGASTCAGVDVYITNGSGSLIPEAGDLISALKNNLTTEHPGWVVTCPGDSPTCALSASSNVQGRFLNGVDASQVCTLKADDEKITGRFIHIEQKAAFRDAEDWMLPFNNTFPINAAVQSEDLFKPHVSSAQLSIYPNPFRDEANVVLAVPFAQSVEVQLSFFSVFLYNSISDVAPLKHHGKLKKGLLKQS